MAFVWGVAGGLAGGVAVGSIISALNRRRCDRVFSEEGGPHEMG